jgi:hypothetical protein
MRRTDVCHPIEITCTRTSCVPGSVRPLRSVDTPRSLWLRRVNDRGTGRFHDARDRFGGSSHDTCTVHLTRFRLDAAAWALSSHGAVCDRASGTPVAPLLRLPPLPSSREQQPCRASSGVPRVGAGRKTEGPPRPLSCAPREKSALETIRDAFHHQGPFVGSGGHYSPGPATTSPLLATVPPLNDGLPSLWASSRSSPCSTGEPDPRRRLRSTRRPTV